MRVLITKMTEDGFCDKTITAIIGSLYICIFFLFTCMYTVLWAALVAQMVKNPPAMQEIWVLSLGWEDPLEESMATHSSILAWRIPMDRGAWQATVHGVAESWT